MSVENILNSFAEIWISEESASSAMAMRARTLVPEKIRWVQAHHQGVERSRASFTNAEYVRGKKTLWLKKHRGQFFKRCPGSTQKESLLCCNYHILNLGSQCNFDCSYCYLQSYLTQPEVQIYTNVDEALHELDSVFADLKNQPLRVGTGEIVDSLSLDPFTLHSHKLIEAFRNYPRWKLEFKTKSSYVSQFLEVPHAGNVVVGFSINPQHVVAKEEKLTASLHDRLTAARAARDRGFLISFHLDPLIHFPEWQTHYGLLVDQITAQFLPHELDVLSVGSLRFQPSQMHIMRQRHGFDSIVTSAEMHPSQSGKLRYDFRLRNEMYQFVLKKFKEHSNEWKIFFCMETPESWIESFESTPSQMEPLKEMFRPIKMQAK